MIDGERGNFDPRKLVILNKLLYLRITCLHDVIDRLSKIFGDGKNQVHFHEIFTISSLREFTTT